MAPSRSIQSRWTTEALAHMPSNFLSACHFLVGFCPGCGFLLGLLLAGFLDESFAGEADLVAFDGQDLDENLITEF